MHVIVVVCTAFGLTVVESKTDSVHMREPKGAAEALAIEAVGQSYKQTESLSTSGVAGDTMREIMKQCGLTHLCFKMYQ